MARASTEEILKTLQARIERAKKRLDGLDPNGDRNRYRVAHKRLKRAQRRLRTWQQLADLLEKRRQAGEKKAAKPAAAATPAEKPAEKSAEPPAESKDKKEEPAPGSPADASTGESAAS